MDWAENPSGHFPFQILRRMNPFRVKESREFIGGKVGKPKNSPRNSLNFDVIKKIWAMSVRDVHGWKSI